MSINSMRKIVVSLFLLVAIGVIFAGYKYKKQIKSLLLPKKENVVRTNTGEPVLAVFSFQPEFENQIIDTFQHLNVWIFDSKKWKIKDDGLKSLDDNIPVLITLETWGGKQLLSRFNHPLQEVADGKYDEVFKAMCTQWIGSRKNVYLRFDPDMEVPVTFYPWQYYGPGYIDAFRRFSEVCKKYAPQAKIVWGPAGYPGVMEFYPGDDVVDAATITLKSDTEMSLDVYPKNYPVKYELQRRLHRLRFMNKPIYVLGSKSSPNDSINAQLVTEIGNQIEEERDNIYSAKNFKRFDVREFRAGNETPEIGFYDPNSLMINEKPVTVEHLFADFGNLADGTFEKSFNEVLSRNHKIIVTFEPFRIPLIDRDDSVLQHITEGKYNKELEAFFKLISSGNQEIYLRYAHEMEIPITRYPWQSQNPVDYIHSFRYFMTFLKPWPENIKRVWGPAGDRGSIEWYPGNDVVDFFSIAIYGLPDKNITDPNMQETFQTIFQRKFWRFRFIDKPLFITEFGVKGPEDFQTKWLEGAAKIIRENHQIVGVNYFNMSDTPQAWGDIKPPDWSISKQSFYRFLEVLNEN